MLFFFTHDERNIYPKIYIALSSFFVLFHEFFYDHP